MGLIPNRTNKTVLSSVCRFGAQIFFDTQQLIVFFNPFASAGCAGLQMAGIQGHRHISNKAVDSLAAAVRDTRTPASLTAQSDRFNGFLTLVA